MAVLLQTRDLNHSVGGRELFRGLTLSLDGGDRLALVGHNGCGKSTLLALLSGAQVADGGEVVQRRGLHIARVEQFLPAALSARPLIDAVADVAAHDQRWRAEVLLADFGFSADDQLLRVGDLSGGQQNRLMLARALMGEPQLLLLDEPTNHLDLATLLVFERVLGEFAGALVIVSHDRAFLDAVTRQTAFLRDGRLYHFALPYSAARAALADADAAAERTRRAEEAHIDRLQQSAKRLAQWGRTYDNEKFARRARSMEKRIERLEGEKTFVSAGSPLNLELELGRSRSRQALVLEDLDVKAGGRTLFHVDHLVVRPGERMALLGHNGVGKSTLIRTLVAALGKDDPHVRFSPQTVLGYYDQELDEVSGAESLMAFAVRRTSRGEQPVRQSLISAGFPFTDHGKVLADLSGGERARLLFLVLSLNAPNLLILDEPTNHIDIDGKEALEAQLEDGSATLLITSHDRRFLTTIAERFLWIRDGALTEIHNPDEFFTAPAAGPASARTGGDAAPRAATARLATARLATARLATRSERAAEDRVLARIVELEELLAADLVRKPKHQKPTLQARWRRELEALYRALD